MLLIVAGGVIASKTADAQYYGIEQLKGISMVGNGGYDFHGAWAEFVIPYYNNGSPATFIKTGSIYVTPEGGSEVKIASISSRFQGQTTVPGFFVYSENNYAIATLGQTAVQTKPYPPVTDWSFLGNNNKVFLVDIVNDKGTASLFIRWYVPSSMTDKKLTFRYDAIIQYTTTISFETDFNKKEFIFSPIPDADMTWDFYADRPGKILLHYAYTDPLRYNIVYFNYSDIHYNAGIGDKPSRNLLLNIANHKQVFGLYSRTVNNSGLAYQYKKDQTITIPAYIWPDTLLATYNNKDSVHLQWSVNKPIGQSGKDFIDEGDFELVRSSDSTFSDKTKFKQVASIDYDPERTEYSAVDNLNDITGSSHVYYRLRRTTTKDQWKWDEYRGADVDIDMNTTQDVDTAILQYSPDGPLGTIKWEPFRGVWTAGTKFSIKKFNKTTSTLAATIDLTEEQARSGIYVDKNIRYCNEFAYSIVVILGNGFDSPSEKPVPGTVLAIKMGTITHLTASKGYFSDRVGLQWHSEGGFSSYSVLRSADGSFANAVQIAAMPANTTADINLLFDDSKGSPGVYYTYYVQGVSDCGGVVRKSKPLSSIGFRAPTGNVYGRITYQNGQAVKNATVRMQSVDQVQLGQSVYLNGMEGSYLKIDSLHTPFMDSAFTVEAWIRPDDAAPADQVIFSTEGQPTDYQLGFDADGQLYFSYNGTTVSGPYFNKNGSYVHLAGIHAENSLSLMINDSVIAVKQVSFQPTGDIGKDVYIGGSANEKNFKGYIDEVRVWNIALSDSQVSRDYTRLLTGGEPGLAAYWRFDETMSGRFFDLSHKGEQYHRNDGLIHGTGVQRTNRTPTFSQLSLKAYTDSSGNYIISGIPFTGSNGTSYNIVPFFGTHRFAPVSVTRLFSANSTTFTVDFTDESSFPVTGFVYYENSTVPVPGVQFRIDGQYAQQGNGNLFQTGDDGKFTIVVPVGTHEVKAVKNNHVFANGGRITNRHGENLNYQEPVGPVVLHDSTTLRFIGRVAGGAVQEAFPLGHSLSTNNLGNKLKITLTLSNPAFNLYNGNNGDSTVIVDHLLPGNVTDSSDIHKTRVVWKQKEVVIYPDSLTGEFAVDLIPEKFIVKSVTATGWGNLLGEEAVSLNLSNKFISQYSVYGITDSMQNGEGTWVYTTHTDSVAYNDSYQFIKRVSPEIKIIQTDAQGKEMSYFGDSIYAYISLGGTRDTIPVIDPGGSGQTKYLFNHPVFHQNKSYHFKIKSFESYPFHDGAGIVSYDNVPTQDGFVTILNNIKNGAAQADTFSLDSTGTGYYDFTAGFPAILPPGLKSFSASMKYGEAGNISWNWLGHPKMQVFNMGQKLSGTDFVTAGPNRIMMVLRDPPGNRSYSFAERGSTITATSSYTTTVDNVNDASAVAHLGPDIITWQGIGVGLIQENDITADAGLSIHLEEHYTHHNTKESTITFTSHYKTSDDPAFVGSVADLYVGHSTNITYGKSNNLIIIKRADLRAIDSVIYQSSATSDYLVVRRQGINFGEKFGTLFAYPQQHIVNVLIPNLISIRNSLLLPSTTSAATAQAKADNTKQQIYVSELPSDDPNFGKSNMDSLAFGEKAKIDSFGHGESYTIYFPTGSKYRTDTIMTLNQYVSGWEQAIADNEKAKLNSDLLKNYSFHAGNPINYSRQTSFSNTETSSFNIIASLGEQTEFGGTAVGIGVTLKTNITVGGSHENSSGTTEGGQSTIGFELAADGVGEYISVDVNETSGGGLAFRTKGGATECPYEGIDTTKYYKPGTVIGLPTAQMDKPQITVENPVVSNVPATQKAAFTLHLTNASEAAWSTNFVLSYGNTDSIKGATIAVEGLPLAGGVTYPSVYGQSITKVITIAKGPDAMSYDNIPIILHSACQYDPTGYLQLIADTVLVSAHFVPSCSNVHVKSPADNWILNTSSPKGEESDRYYLPVTLDQFDMNNSLFDHIALQYKPSAGNQWITVMNFYGDSAKYKSAEGDKSFITDATGIDYKIEMGDGAFSDQKYKIRALAVCKLGPGNEISTSSNVVSGLKDTYNPRLFGSPQPANGVLGVEGEIRLNFNEPIAAGLLTQTDFKVTGIRNGSKGNHSVAVLLDGQNDYLQTEFDKNLTCKDMTVEMWVLPDAQEEETIFSQGNINYSMEMAFTADNHLQVIMGNKVIKSGKPLKYAPNEWAHVAMVYNAETGKVSAFYNFTEVIHEVSVEEYTGIGPFEFGRSISEEGRFFAGKIHEARVWSEVRSATRLQINSLTHLSGAENSLLAYYPMDEGKGRVVFDKAHGNNARLVGHWSMPPGKAITVNGNGYVKMSAALSPVTTEMDYTLGLWFKGAPGQTNAALVSNGKGDGTDPSPDGSKDLFFLGFENGLLTFENNGFKVQIEGHYLDNNWHQVTIAVNRVSGVAQLYVDGNLKKAFDAQNLGGIASAYIYLGARAWYASDDAVTPHFDRYFTGEIDEFRLWHTYLNKTLITNNSNIRLKGDELGLLIYYPFEKYYSGEMDSTLTDQKTREDPNVNAPYAIVVNATISDDMAPIKDRGPVENLKFDFVVNNDALIINMLESKQDIAKTIVTLQAESVRDKNGNPIVSPITWTAYIDQNQLKWSDDVLNLTKAENKPMQFESYVINNGGNVQHFRLDNLPGWLTAFPTSGTVDPKGKQKITFTLNEGLNVGAYNEIVYMINDNDVSETLSINLKVTGNAPGWEVNPAAFEYSMTVYGKLRVNNIFSDNPEDMLAAFMDGKCVGVAYNTYIKKNDFWYVFLTIYNDSVQADNLSFRLWNAGDGKIYTGIPSTPIAFENDAVAGAPRSPVIFDGRELMIENIPLQKGWNWLSFNLFSNDLKDVDAMLSNGIWHSGDIIKDMKKFDQYSTTEGWLGILPELNNLSLFKLKTATAQTLSIGGTPVDIKNTPIPLKGGQWNYIGYLPLDNMTVGEALAGYLAQTGDQIKSQTGFAMYDSRLGWVGNLTYLEPGKGYMLYRSGNTDTSFTYPSLAGILRLSMGADPLNSARLNPWQLPVKENFSFADNMTVVAAVDKGFHLLPGDKVLVYAGTNLRAKAKPIANPATGKQALFFNISGKSAQLLHFEVERNRKIVARTGTVMSYHSNSRIGSLSEPFLLSFNKQQILAGVFPNPFHDKLTIRLHLSPGSHVVQLSVYNMKGQLVYRRQTEKVKGKTYDLHWTGSSNAGADCAPGVYFIRLRIDGKQKVYKVIKY